MKNLKGNNKGFSLVELIVVIAIMGILAVTLAPRLTQYVEKSRKASDKEAVNTIFTAAKLAKLEDPSGFALAANQDGTADNYFVLGGAADSTLYNVTAGKTWEISSAFEGFVAPETANLYVDTLQEILGDFNLKSSDVGAETNIVISMTGTKINVALYYIYDAATSNLTNTSYLISE